MSFAVLQQQQLIAARRDAAVVVDFRGRRRRIKIPRLYHRRRINNLCKTTGTEKQKKSEKSPREGASATKYAPH